MEQSQILRRAAETLESLDVAYLVVGSCASIAYGEARFTQDIDIVAAFELKHVPGMMAAFPSPEYYLSRPAMEEAIRSSFQFNVIHPGSGNKIDFILPRADAWAKVRMDRRRPVRLLPDRDVMTAAPEDVILGKLWYYSLGGGDRHLRDIAGILRVTGDGVDRAGVDAGLGSSAIWKSGRQSSSGSMHPTDHRGRACPETSQDPGEEVASEVGPFLA